MENTDLNPSVNSGEMDPHASDGQAGVASTGPRSEEPAMSCENQGEGLSSDRNGMPQDSSGIAGLEGAVTGSCEGGAQEEGEGRDEDIVDYLVFGFGC